MNSLVAYDDSDSEAEAGKSEDAASNEMGLTDSATSAVRYYSGLYTVSENKGQPVECTGSSRRNVYHEDALLQNLQSIKKPMVTDYPKTFYPSNLKIASRDHNKLLSSGNESCSQKRAHDDHDVPIQGLRPYIPKRMRLVKNAIPHEAEGSGEGTNCATKIGTAEDRMSIKVSQYMMPYIGSKYGATEIPKNLVFQMSDHSGPVNVVQWCPLQKWSHMLLSASMDKTVKTKVD
ncbi:hypothetical protein JD844_020710 [Phrynosoma platyrhinos]|uniref:WD repeat-containing protein 25 n=1 Tax=Phrynosoma platyrhinos TaxID=52577 RepID=A0ABQ7SSM6_PHRPL|nr:hypothetical protein JD844_020710 [Phrynosoma platyrhinos]